MWNILRTFLTLELTNFIALQLIIFKILDMEKIKKKNYLKAEK